MDNLQQKNEIVVYEPDETTRLDVRLDDDTVWLTQNQMTDLFQRDRTVITRHINNVFSDGELDEKSNVHFLHIPFSDKPVKVYSLNVIISVGYRVKSMRGTQFRIWATNVLREYLLRGYAVNARLSQLEDKVDRRFAKTEADIAELKDKVDFFVQTKVPPLQGVFFDGQLWDARALVLKLISSAKRSLILIDNWATPEVLDLFAKKRALGKCCQCDNVASCQFQFPIEEGGMMGTTVASGNIGIGNTSTTKTPQLPQRKFNNCHNGLDGQVKNC